MIEDNSKLYARDNVKLKIEELSNNSANLIVSAIENFNNSGSQSFTGELNKFATYKFSKLEDVDEASMIPEDLNDSLSKRSLLEDLIKYVYEGIDCKLILIGDTAKFLKHLQYLHYLKTLVIL